MAAAAGGKIGRESRNDHQRHLKHDTQQFIRQIASIQPVQYLVKQLECPGLRNIGFHPVIDDLRKITGIGCFFEMRTNLAKRMPTGLPPEAPEGGLCRLCRPDRMRKTNPGLRKSVCGFFWRIWQSGRFCRGSGKKPSKSDHHHQNQPV